MESNTFEYLMINYLQKFIQVVYLYTNDIHV